MTLHRITADALGKFTYPCGVAWAVVIIAVAVVAGAIWEF